MKLFQHSYFFTMNNRPSLHYLIMIVALGFTACHGRIKAGNENNALANSVSLHTGDEKYAAIDTKESVVTWKGSNSFGGHTGYVYVSKGELMIENGQLMGGTVEVDMNTNSGKFYDNLADKTVSDSIEFHIKIVAKRIMVD